MALGTNGNSSPRSVTILGSTGSVGCSTIDLIRRDRPAFVVEALTANSNVEKLALQAEDLGARFVAIGDESRYLPLKERLAGSGIEVAAGEPGVVEAAARSADWVMAAIVGAAGLAPTLAAIRRGAVVALANKEVLVCAGDLVTAEVRRYGATLLPVDSEHNAIYQVFDFTRIEAVEKIILTASGGPFRSLDSQAMSGMGPARALKHPTWNMGAKISIDSATMMNKGLELIEAKHLFGLPEQQIEILVHPQSVIHSLVAYIDGSVLAQLGSPDMRTPIAFTLAWPRRMASPSPRLDLTAIGQLTFEAPDPVRFPALRLAREALVAGGSAPTVLNAANEVAVQAYLDRQIGFLDIASIVEQTLAELPVAPIDSLDDVHNFDKRARNIAARRAGMAGRA
jgi:1-deoxy-D-xylulose-5-phosphate reductoisomerase